MPFVTEYSCRLKNPKRFKQDSFRRISSGDVDLVIARPYGKTKTRAQAIRYPRELWDEKSARQSCRKRKGKFEDVKKPKLQEATHAIGLAGALQKWKVFKSKYPYYPYDIVKRKNKWYLIAHTGGRYWMPIGEGHRTKKEAVADAKRQLQADKAARRLIYQEFGG